MAKQRRTLSGLIISLYEDPKLVVRLRQDPIKVLTAANLSVAHRRIVRRGNVDEIHRTMVKDEGVSMNRDWITITFHSAKPGSK